MPIASRSHSPNLHRSSFFGRKLPYLRSNYQKNKTTRCTPVLFFAHGPCLVGASFVPCFFSRRPTDRDRGKAWRRRWTFCGALRGRGRWARRCFSPMERAARGFGACDRHAGGREPKDCQAFWGSEGVPSTSEGSW